MSGYIIYVRNELTNKIISYDIENISGNVKYLLDEILPIYKKVSYMDIILSDGDVLLADLGIGPETTLIGYPYTDDENMIIEEYSKEALIAYYKIYGDKEAIAYDEFMDRYVGEFNSRKEFFEYDIDPLLISELPKWLYKSLYGNWCNNRYLNYSWYNYHYFKEY